MLTQQTVETVVANVKADARMQHEMDNAVINGIVAFYIAKEIDIDYYIYINSDNVMDDIEQVIKAI